MAAARTSMTPRNKQTDSMSQSHLSALMMLSSQLLSTGRFNSGLPAFITRGLDSEQVWQQLELRNDHKLSLTACTREVVRIQSSTANRKQKLKRRKKHETKGADELKEQSENALLSSDSDSDQEDMLNSIKKRLAEEPSENMKDLEFSDESGEDGLDFDFEMEKEISKGLSDEEKDDDIEDMAKPKSRDKKKAVRAPKKPSVVDDKFFKLSEMEEFLDAEDKKEEKRRKREDKKDNTAEDSDDDSEEEDEEVDMFAELEDGSDDNAGNAKYSDFFDPPHDEMATDKDQSLDASANGDDNGSDEEGGEEEEDDEEMDDDDEEDEDGDDDSINADGKTKESKKSVSFEDGPLLFGSEDDGDDNEEDSEKQTSTGVKSTFEKRQEQLQAKAREMEEQSLKEAPWELTGEATATKRPENSLLETVLDFQHTTRAAPVITDETTKTLEDFIKQRIKDKAFDDVERKVKPKEDPFEFKKRIVLDQEKSKMSLGELYEQEFLKQQQEDKDEVKADPECEKIEGDLKKLFKQLDALCNFRYTPFQAGTEVKIIVNTPAISMEEVAPTATADAQLLAPEEVKEKIRGDLKADDERDATDKKRQHREKKKEKRERKKAKEAREKLVEKIKPGLGNKYSKAKAIKQLEQISKTDRNVTMIKGDNQKLTSSTSFFNQLQEEVQTNVRAKKAAKVKKKSKAIDPSKIML